MFSRRSSWDLQPNRLSVALEERRRRGERVIDLTQSNPTQVGLQYPAEIRAILARAEGLVYWPAPAGRRQAREAVCRYYGDKGVRIEADQVWLTASTSEAYGFLFKLLADPGDEILVPSPSYPLFEFLATLENVQLRTYPLRYREAGWEIDLDRLVASLGPRTRAVVLVNPNNPTGSFVRPQEQEAIEALAQEAGLALIADEVFADYQWEKGLAPAAVFVGRGEVLTFVLSGLSKVLGLPQLKLSWMVVQGPAAQQREALARLEVIADTYLSVGTLVQEALPGLLACRQEIQAQIRKRVEGNLRLLKDRLAGAAGGRLLPCEGGWYAVLAGPRDEEEVALELLREEGVLVHPGYFFDFAQEGFLVLSLLPADFAEGVDRLLAHL